MSLAKKTGLFTTSTLMAMMAISSAHTWASSTTSNPAQLVGLGGDNEVLLEWADAHSSSNYQIYYDTDDNPEGRHRLATTRPDELSYLATDLKNGVPYWFWVKYTDANGKVNESDAFNITLTGAELNLKQHSPTGKVNPNAIVVNSESELLSAIDEAQAGDTIYIRGGNYYFSDPIFIETSGTALQRITLSKYPEDADRPLLDFSAMSESKTNRGFELLADYWYVYGIDVQKAGDNGMHITGSNNIIEFSTFSRNADTGLQLDSGASYNLIKNVDSYYNADSTIENADGFAAKITVGNGNYFYGCRAWNNLDDGFDGYMRGDGGVTTIYENSWAIRNGYSEDGVLGGGDGNGFKTGGSDNKDLAHNAILLNTIAAGNAERGFDQNFNRGEITILNAVAYKNGFNIAALTINPAKKLTVKNTISYDPVKTPDELYALSTNISNNSWQDGLKVSADDFESMDIDELLAPRKPNGDLPEVNFFKLKEDSDLVDAGTYVGIDFKGKAPDIGAFELK